MWVGRLDDLAEYRRRVAPLLEEDEVRHTVMLGVLDTLAREPDRYPGHALWLAAEGEETLAAATRTPPFHVLVARPRSREPLVALAEEMHRQGADAPGVNGARPEADWFAEAWRAATGCALEDGMQLRLHALERVEPVPAAPGMMRAAVAADESHLVAWMAAFAEEAGIQGSDEQHTAMIRGGLDRPLGVVLWEDAGEPVSFAASRRTSAGIARVGPVYTPPERRRRGYATALVAGLTRELLAAGAERCLLYTDLANPTSNAIYRSIGYQPLLDAVEINFVT